MIILSIADDIGDKISLILIATLVLVLIRVFIKACIKERKDRKQLLEELEQPYVEQPLFECKAVIVEKFCQRENKGGVKIPDTQECCYVVVKTIDGRLHKCGVTLEEYCNAKENQEVTVALEGDKVFGINFD